MTTLPTDTTAATEQGSATHFHPTIHVIHALDHNYFFVNGPDTTATHATFLGQTVSGDGHRANFMEGSAANPIVPSGASSIADKPTMLLSKNTKPNPLVLDAGSLQIHTHGYDNGGGPGIIAQPQVNVMQIISEQGAPSDLMNLGSQILMTDPRGGTGYAYYTNVQLYQGQTITITHASPAVVTFTAHGQTGGTTARLGTTGGLPTGITAGQQYNVVPSASPDTFYLCLPGFLNVANIASITLGTPTTINTTAAHGLSTGDSIVLAGTTTTPNINSGISQITVTGATSFTIPSTTTIGQAGAGGNYTRLINTTSNGSGTHSAVCGTGIAAMNPLIANTSGVNFIYDGYGTMIMANIMLQAIQDGSHPNDLAGIGIAMGPGNSMRWDTAIAVYAGTVYQTTFVDDSSSITSINLRGTHTTGIDLSSGTFTVPMKVDAQYQLAFAGGNPIVQFDSSDFFSYNRSANTYGWAIGGTAAASLGPTPSAGNTNLSILDSSGSVRLIGIHNDGTRDLLYLE